jgi:hypothetical protein
LHLKAQRLVPSSSHDPLAQLWFLRVHIFHAVRVLYFILFEMKLPQILESSMDRVFQMVERSS